MAHKIDKEKCIACGACEGTCPSGAISEDEDGKYVIDPNKCTDCGECVDICAAEAISKE